VYYTAFGLSLCANGAVPGLIPQPPGAAPDTSIWLDAVPPACRPGADQEAWYSSPALEGAEPALMVWKVAGGAYFRLRYGDGTEFVVDRMGGEVWATWADSSTLEDTATYLLGPIMGFVLRLRGVTCLHASAVAVGDRAIALVGPASAGKSTTAAAFARLGHPIISDDIVALSEPPGGLLRVQPAFPQLRLWPDSVALLYGSEDALPCLTPNWDKRALDLTANGCQFQSQPLPLAAIYVLAERGSPEAEPRIVDLQGREKLLTLLANTYVSYLVDGAMRRAEFSMLGHLATCVPVRHVTGSSDPARVSELCVRILEDWAALAA
jgi:hypothetical protein